MRRGVARALHGAVLVLVVAPIASVVLAAPAAAHPLGNFTVNRYDALTLTPDRVEVLSVVDRAEIPTVQAMPSIDTDGNGSASPAELAAAAEQECPALARALTGRVGDADIAFDLTEAAMVTAPGAASLLTLRLTCRLTARVDLTEATTVTFRNAYLDDRVGWREITATGDGVSLVDPVVPAVSISDELQQYPSDLLASPPDIRSVELTVTPGGGGGGLSNGLVRAAAPNDPFGRIVAAGDTRLQSLIASPDLTIWVGALAVVLAALLGSGHALLPGHGKTVMAAYLAGRRGRRRDALIVGATVTLTHTVGVLVIGLLLTVASAVAGEDVLQVLGIVSGLLIIAVGAALLRDAWRDRRAHRAVPLGVAEDGRLMAAMTSTAGGAVATLTRTDPHQHSHEQGPGHHAHDSHHHDHDGHDEDHDGHHHDHDHDARRHGHDGHGHSHGRGAGGHSHGFGKRGLIGLGVAGGLVPSPSALVVLLGAIALGRTGLGVLLVLAYGLGMAATLTAVGLLLVNAQRRLSRLKLTGPLAVVLRRGGQLMPLITAGLVIVVGVGLCLQSLSA